jgi:hypothetical protein
LELRNLHLQGLRHGLLDYLPDFALLDRVVFFFPLRHA